MPWSSAPRFGRRGARRQRQCARRRGAVAGQGTLAGAKPVRMVGSFWPYATTLFDSVRRAVPFDPPQPLSDAEVYAVSAYLRHLNGIVAADTVLGAARLPAVAVPNRAGFVPDAWPAVKGP